MGKIIIRSMIFYLLGIMLCGELFFSFNLIKIEWRLMILIKRCYSYYNSYFGKF